MARSRGRGAAHEIRRCRLHRSGKDPGVDRLAEARGELWRNWRGWSTEASSDRHAELFISPQLTDAARIVDVLAHELDHATVGTAVGHGKAFKQCALAIGLVGPMRATTAGPEFSAWAQALFKCIGPYPAGYLTDTPKQGTRMLKCECSACGYIARVSQKWLTLSGPPICPSDRIVLITAKA